MASLRLSYITVCFVFGITYTAEIRIAWFAPAQQTMRYYNNGVQSSMGAVQYAITMLVNNQELLDGHNFT